MNKNNQLILIDIIKDNEYMKFYAKDMIKRVEEKEKRLNPNDNRYEGKRREIFENELEKFIDKVGKKDEEEKERILDLLANIESRYLKDKARNIITLNQICKLLGVRKNYAENGILKYLRKYRVTDRIYENLGDYIQIADKEFAFIDSFKEWCKANIDVETAQVSVTLPFRKNDGVVYEEDAEKNIDKIEEYFKDEIETSRTKDLDRLHNTLNIKLKDIGCQNELFFGEGSKFNWTRVQSRTNKFERELEFIHSVNSLKIKCGYIYNSDVYRQLAFKDVVKVKVKRGNNDTGEVRYMLQNGLNDFKTEVCIEEMFTEDEIIKFDEVTINKVVLEGIKRYYGDKLNASEKGQRLSKDQKEKISHFYAIEHIKQEIIKK